MADEDISPLLTRVRDKLGIDFTHYRESTLRRRISRRISACNCDDLSQYVSILDSNDAEYQHLLRDLTIKYSEFYRDPEVFDFVASRVIPEIIAAKRGDTATLRIWSAGCATGEEAYSIAAVALQAAKHAGRSVEIKVLATDIDPKAIEFARAGVYAKELAAKPIPEAISGYFTDDGKVIAAGDAVREAVTFKIHDLTSRRTTEHIRELAASAFDLILCRNVLIYFYKQGQVMIIQTCLDMLRERGILVLGNREVVQQPLASRLLPLDQKLRVFRKCAGTEEEKP